MANLVLLRSELLDDPLVRGYAGMTDQVAANDLNSEETGRTLLVPTVPTTDIHDAIDPAEYDGLTDLDKAKLSDIFTLNNASTAPGNTRATLLSIFGAGTASRDNLLALAQQDISRAIEINIGTVHAGDVGAARA